MYPEFPSTLIVLSGKTGSGKTLVLQQLGALGYPVIDLEKIASHRGSAFGHAGLRPQPSQSLFEKLLRQSCMQYQSCNYIFTEEEAPSIGKRRIPDWFCKKLKEGIYVRLEVSLQQRVKNIVNAYSPADATAIRFSLDKLQQRLSAATITQLKTWLSEANYEAFASRLLTYYDASKRYNNTDVKPIIEILINDFDAAAVAALVLDLLAQQHISVRIA